MYVGQHITDDPATRWKSHLFDALYNRKNRAICSAIRKYGPEAFRMEVIDRADRQEDLNQLESFHIRRLGTFPPSLGVGYNMTAGGEGLSGFSHRESTKDKIGAKARERMRDPAVRAAFLAVGSTAAKGLRHTEEWKQNFSRARVGHPVSEETRQKIAGSKRGIPRDEATRAKLRVANTGSHHSDEAKAKIGAFFRGRKLSEEHRTKLRKPKSPEHRAAMRAAWVLRKQQITA